MSYHKSLGHLPDFASTSFFAEAVDPYAMRFLPPGGVYSPYGWGPEMSIGMPFSYTHHIGYERTPVPGARRTGPLYDEVGRRARAVSLGSAPARAGSRRAVDPYAPRQRQIPFTNRGDVRYYAIGQYETDYRQLGDSGDGLGAVPLVVL